MENENPVTVQRITLSTSKNNNIVDLYVKSRNTIGSPSTRSLFIGRAEAAPKKYNRRMPGAFCGNRARAGARDRVRNLAGNPPLIICRAIASILCKSKKGTSGLEQKNQRNHNLLDMNSLFQLTPPGGLTLSSALD